MFLSFGHQVALGARHGLTRRKQVPAQPIGEIWLERRLTQRDLAQKTGIHFTTLCEILNGRVLPTVDQRRRLADFFRVPESHLFDDDTVDQVNELRGRNPRGVSG